MAKLTIGGLVGDAAMVASEKLGAFADIAILPVLATAAAIAGLGLMVGGDAQTGAVFLLAINLIALAIEAPAMAAWVRVCCGHDSPPDRQYRFGPAEARFFRYSLLFTGVAGALAALMLISASQGQQAGAFLALGASIGFFIILPRLMLALPAAALGREDQKIGDMLKLSEGRTAILFFACAIALPPLLAVLLLGGRIGGAAEDLFSGTLAAALWTAFWITLSRYVLQAALLAISARAYLALTTPKGSTSP